MVRKTEVQFDLTLCQFICLANLFFNSFKYCHLEQVTKKEKRVYYTYIDQTLTLIKTDPRKQIYTLLGVQGVYD